MVYHSFRYSLGKRQIAWANGTKTVYDICSCCRHLGFIQLNIGLLPGVIVPVFIEFTVATAWLSPG